MDNKNDANDPTTSSTGTDGEDNGQRPVGTDGAPAESHGSPATKEPQTEQGEDGAASGE